MLHSEVGADKKGASKTMRSGRFFDMRIWLSTENIVLRNGMPRPGSWTTISDQYSGNNLQALAMARQLCIRLLRCFLRSNIDAALSSTTVLKISSTSKNTSTGTMEPLLAIHSHCDNNAILRSRTWNGFLVSDTTLGPLFPRGGPDISTKVRSQKVHITPRTNRDGQDESFELWLYLCEFVNLGAAQSAVW